MTVEHDTTHAFTMYEGVSDTYVMIQQPEGGIGYHREDGTMATNFMLTTLRRVYPDGYFNPHGLPSAPECPAPAPTFNKLPALKVSLQSAATIEGKVKVATAFKATAAEIVEALGLPMTAADIDALILARAPNLYDDWKQAQS
jgi:hypothetical protein